MCILIALVGEGLKISEVEVPRLSWARSVTLVAVGIVFVALGFVSGRGAA